jgi:hypothetical protein
MRIKFKIADPQPIDVEISRDWFTGSFKCIADGKAHELKSPLSLGTHFALSTTHNYSVEVGDATKHLIEIEHSRPRFFGGVRPQRYIVKVDGDQVADETGF